MLRKSIFNLYLKDYFMLKMYSPSGYPDVDEFVSSSGQIWGIHLLINGSSAVNGCRQNERLNS